MYYLIMVYYSRRHLDEVVAAGFMQATSELWDTAHGREHALSMAQKHSQNYPEHEFAVEGGDIEPGGFDTPVFKGGKQIQ